MSTAVCPDATSFLNGHAVHTPAVHDASMQSAFTMSVCLAEEDVHKGSSCITPTLNAEQVQAQHEDDLADVTPDLRLAGDCLNSQRPLP